MIKPNFSKIDALLKHLNLVQQIAKEGYWITTDEVCTLLSFDQVEFEALNSKQTFYNFEWRNFSFTQVSSQGTTKMWEVCSKQKIDLNLFSSTLQPLIQTQPKFQIEPQKVIGEEGQIISSEYAWVENFLTTNQCQRLLEHVKEEERNFISTSNSDNDPNYRRSQVLYSFPEFAELMTARILAITPFILTYLRLDSFNPSNIEIQLTQHNDGNYYKIHNDNGSIDCANRILTYVYYFHLEPKAFSGGELVLYDNKIENNFYVEADTYKKVTPQHNCIVFFPSHYMHEVLTVNCPSRAFMDSRFTINGWVRN